MGLKVALWVPERHHRSKSCTVGPRSALWVAKLHYRFKGCTVGHMAALWVQKLHCGSHGCTMGPRAALWMNENLYIAHKKLSHKTMHVHSATRYTQSIHVSSCKLKLPKDTLTEKYKQFLPSHPFPKVELYIAVKCKNIYRVTNNDNRKKDSHTHTHSNYGNISFT